MRPLDRSVMHLYGCEPVAQIARCGHEALLHDNCAGKRRTNWMAAKFIVHLGNCKTCGDHMARHCVSKRAPMVADRVVELCAAGCAVRVAVARDDEVIVLADTCAHPVRKSAQLRAGLGSASKRSSSFSPRGSLKVLPGKEPRYRKLFVKLADAC